MTDRWEVCDACGGDGGGDYCSGHCGGEPIYTWVDCSACSGDGRIPLCPPDELLPGEPMPREREGVFICDLDEEIPF